MCLAHSTQMSAKLEIKMKLSERWATTVLVSLSSFLADKCGESAGLWGGESGSAHSFIWILTAHTGLAGIPRERTRSKAWENIGQPRITMRREMSKIGYAAHKEDTTLTGSQMS